MTDPLATLMDPENAPAAHGAWHAKRHRASDDVELIDDDGCSLFVSPDEVAALLAYRLASDRQGGLGMSETRDVITADTLRAVMRAMRDAPYRPCEHVIYPPRPGTRYVEASLDDPDHVVRRCANLCGFAIALREVPS